jgi:hypothetical protein
MFAARSQFFAQPAGGAFGNNMFFPATTNQYVSKPGTTGLVTWKATTGFTVEYWGFWTAFSSTINGGPGNSDGASTNYWTFGPITSGILEFYFWGPGQNYIKTTTGVIPLNTWTSIAAVFTTTGSNTIVSLYVNGVRQNVQLNNTGAFAATQTATNGAVSSGTPFGLGRYGSNFITGFVNNLRVSNINRYSGASYSLATQDFISDANTQILIVPTGVPGTTIPYTGAVSGNMTNASNLVTNTATRANHT